VLWQSVVGLFCAPRVSSCSLVQKSRLFVNWSDQALVAIYDVCLCSNPFATFSSFLSALHDVCCCCSLGKWLRNFVRPLDATWWMTLLRTASLCSEPPPPLFTADVCFRIDWYCSDDRALDVGAPVTGFIHLEHWVLFNTKKQFQYLVQRWITAIPLDATYDTWGWQNVQFV
jgi:hypothetical protein